MIEIENEELQALLLAPKRGCRSKKTKRAVEDWFKVLSTLSSSEVDFLLALRSLNFCDRVALMNGIKHWFKGWNSFEKTLLDIASRNEVIKAAMRQNREFMSVGEHGFGGSGSPKP